MTEVPSSELLPPPPAMLPSGSYSLSFGEMLQLELSRGIPRKAGVLMKLGGKSFGVGVFKSWKERWIVCDGPYLKYFESPKDYAGKPKGWFELEGARVAHTKHPKSPSNFAFELIEVCCACCRCYPLLFLFIGYYCLFYCYSASFLKL